MKVPFQHLPQERRFPACNSRSGPSEYAALRCEHGRSVVQPHYVHLLWNIVILTATAADTLDHAYSS
jgi:hypothetical protein